MDVFEGLSVETFEVERSLLEFEEGTKQLGVQAHDEAQRILGHSLSSAQPLSLCRASFCALYKLRFPHVAYDNC